MSECIHSLFEDQANHSLDEVRERLVELEDREAMLKLPAILFVGIVLLAGLFGNLLVCVVYYLKFPASTSKYFILSLAVFDLLNCTIAIPAEMVDLRYDYHFNSPTICRIMRFTITFNTSASAGTLLAIAVDRYRKICRPFGKQMSLMQIKFCIVCAVMASLTVSWPATLLYGRNTRMYEGVEVFDCSFDDSVKDTSYPRVYIVVMTILCIASIGILIVLYVLIVMKVWRQKQKRKKITSSNWNKSSPSPSIASSARRLNCTNNDGANDLSGLQLDADVTNDVKRKQTSGQSQSIKTTLMLLVVTAVFVVSFIPYFTLMIVKSAVGYFEDDLHCNHSAMVAYKLFLRSFFINSAANPLVYSFWNDKFRVECKLFLTNIFCHPSTCSGNLKKDAFGLDTPTRLKNIEIVIDE
ncbi:orexin receptor type 2-like [Gigantopelta aegis]|uniref:orexin receptor type 2-like n=1 Tax=Gigantopelta aegis TaxID=1735272 RepID=UPI001B88DD4F|nr:orexin receptor type 2-like [Gigantopelta aegis]